MEGGDTPAFVSEAATALSDTVNDTIQLANLKYHSLKVILIILNGTLLFTTQHVLSF